MKCLYCKNNSSKRQMCGKHYRQWWRTLNPEKEKKIQQTALIKKRAVKIITYKIDIRLCNRCLKSFTRIKGTNRIYCSKTCQNGAMCRKKLNKPNTKLIHNLRSRLRKILKGPKTQNTIKLLGCSSNFLKFRLQLLFRRRPRDSNQIMTWNNYGEWEIDHIRPLASFDLSDPLQLKEACYYTNLQPLWKEENRKKADTI